MKINQGGLTLEIDCIETDWKEGIDMHGVQTYWLENGPYGL